MINSASVLCYCLSCQKRKENRQMTDWVYVKSSTPKLAGSSTKREVEETQGVRKMRSIISQSERGQNERFGTQQSLKTSFCYIINYQNCDWII